MLRQKFSAKALTIAIAEDGIAYQPSGQPIRMLSELDINAQHFPDLVKTLSPHENALKSRSINLLLSNAYFKFLVLPWQANVYAREDWIGLANHRFRQQFGPIADSWEIKVHLGQYGHAVVACAMEKSVYQVLLASEKQIGCRWSAISPVMTKLVQPASKNNDWIMMVEPQHLLLVEKVSGHYHRISTMTPPLGSESEFIRQMITRRTLSLSKAYQPQSIRIFVSGSLPSTEFIKPEHPAVTFVFDKRKHPSHASWLASLG